MPRTNSLLALTNTDLLLRHFVHDQHFVSMSHYPQVEECVPILREQSVFEFRRSYCKELEVYSVLKLLCACHFPEILFLFVCFILVKLLLEHKIYLSYLKQVYFRHNMI